MRTIYIAKKKTVSYSSHTNSLAFGLMQKISITIHTDSVCACFKKTHHVTSGQKQINVISASLFYFDVILVSQSGLKLVSINTLSV